MKKVLFTLYKKRTHSLYKQFIDNPPLGYQYYTLDDFFDDFIFEKSTNIFLEVVAKIKRNRQIIEVAKNNNIDIIYCCDGILLFNSSIPWIVDFEHTTSLFSHLFKYWSVARKVLPLILKQRSLKYIIPWTEAGKKSLELNLKLSKESSQKIKPIHLCLKIIDDFEDIESRKLKHNDFTLLFVTSVNYNGEREFYSKGGKIAIGVFEKLKKYKKIKLILRSRIPKEFSYLKSDPQVEIYEDILAYDKFQDIFLKSNCFFSPSYQSPGMAFLDAMNYNLPIITTDVFANKEMVKTGKNGFLVSFPEVSNKNHLFQEYGIKHIPSGNKSKDDMLDEGMVDDFVKIIVNLKENHNLLKNMNKYSKNLLEKEFSLEKRNSALKEIFDNCLIQ